MNVIAERLEKQYPQSNDKLRTAVVPLDRVIVGEIRPILLLLLAAVGLLLMIACANVANLLLARALSRRNEMAIRAALGASRARLVGLMLMEGLVLSFTGALAGLAVAHGMIKGFVALIPASRFDDTVAPTSDTDQLRPGSSSAIESVDSLASRTLNPSGNPAATGASA